MASAWLVLRPAVRGRAGVQPSAPPAAGVTVPRFHGPAVGAPACAILHRRWRCRRGPRAAIAYARRLMVAAARCTWCGVWGSAAALCCSRCLREQANAVFSTRRPQDRLPMRGRCQCGGYGGVGRRRSHCASADTPAVWSTQSWGADEGISVSGRRCLSGGVWRMKHEHSGQPEGVDHARRVQGGELRHAVAATAAGRQTRAVPACCTRMAGALALRSRMDRRR